MIQQTSIDAYRAAVQSGVVNERQREVLEYLALNGPQCSKDVVDQSGIPPNVVTPRIFELREKGLVVESHRAPNPSTGRKSIYWKVAA